MERKNFPTRSGKIRIVDPGRLELVVALVLENQISEVDRRGWHGLAWHEDAGSWDQTPDGF